MSALGTLFSKFKTVKQETKIKINTDLWKKHGMPMVKQRAGHEIKEYSVDMGDKTILVHELWKKVDEVRVELKLDLKSAVITKSDNPVDDISDLLL